MCIYIYIYIYIYICERLKKTSTWRRTFLFAWILLLLTYEQLLGLAVVMMTIILILNFEDNIYKTIKNTAPSLIVITIIQVICFLTHSLLDLIKLDKLVNTAELHCRQPCSC